MEPVQDSVISLRGVDYAPPRAHPILRSFSLALGPGRVLGLVGPSGCGKSTLLRVVAGLAAPSAGEVQVKGRPAFVFQSPTLLPWRTLRRNVSLPLELAGRPDAAAVDEALARVGLLDAAERLPHQLSGGMRMRGSLARALVSRPEIMLLDEPFSAVDALTRGKLHEEFRRVQTELGFSAVLVTHDIEEAALLCDEVCVLAGPPLAQRERFDGFRARGPEARFEPGFATLVRAIEKCLAEAGA